jgi:hypothetical protein
MFSHGPLISQVIKLNFFKKASAGLALWPIDTKYILKCLVHIFDQKTDLSLNDLSS